jgi:soluble lytic murein transglycosylase
LGHLERALRVRSSDPAEAARQLEAAGPGAALEALRLDLWLEALRGIDAAPAAWRALVDASSSSDVAADALVGLAEARRREGEDRAADDLLEAAHDDLRVQADVALLGSPDEATRLRAARRLALDAPERLRVADRATEVVVVATLGADEWLQRSRAWRAAGRASAAAAELRRMRWRGPDEDARRRELAWAELEAGRSSSALALVPRSRADDPDAALLRAQALRRRGWSRVPDGAWRSAFGDCAREAGRAVASLTDPARRAAADEVLLECATESGDLELAWSAWRSLEVRGWSSDRRDWLGRRLGVALAKGGDRRSAVELADAIRDHERCIRWWLADGRPEALRKLVSDPVDDLYSRWSREDLGLANGGAPPRQPDLAPGDPPSAVGWLLDRGEPRLAAAEWQRDAADRPPSAAEAIAAAALSESLGRRNDAIRWLRRGVPELGGIDTLSAPRNAVRAYLPLDWTAELEAAAREHGLPPWLLAGVARQESTFLPAARSAAGATGLLQLMPGTATGHARSLGLPRPVDLTDPAVNLRLGARELADVLRQFGALEPALAAYNAGPSRVRRWWRRWNDPRELTEAIPIPETYGYVRRVVFLADAYRLAYADEWKEPS